MPRGAEEGLLGHDARPYRPSARSPAAKHGLRDLSRPGLEARRGPERCPGSIRAFAKRAAARRQRDLPDLPRSAAPTRCGRAASHDARNLSCATCHSVHTFKSEHAQLKTAREMDTCATCHRDKVAKIDRSGHMPLREGKMECSTCHNPHGSTNVKQLRKGDSVAEMCTSCHADKRGPFLWEHAPTRDGCTTCHDPHGSSNERMLVTKPPILCQRCHVATRHPEHHLRRRADRIGADAERAHLRAIVRDLPLEHPRLEPPERPALHPVKEGIMRMSARSRDCARSAADVPCSGWRSPRATRRTEAGTRQPAGASRLPRRAAAAAGGRGEHRVGRLRRFRCARHEPRRRRRALRALPRPRRRAVPRDAFA